MANKFPNYDSAQKWPASDPIPDESGIYAIFLRSTDSLPDEWKDILKREDHLLYIGKAKKNEKAKNIGKAKTGLNKRLQKHFMASDSTKVTFRRSVGAVLREFLNLKPCFHSSASSEGQYSFWNEEALSKWIRGNCFFSYQMLPSEEAKETERLHIHNLCPPLNINDNPRKIGKVKDARKECAEIAKQASSN
ncbi:MAG: GIY-YIG nuclease family protein [Candidatus Puniceispirillales bacterium]